VPKILIGLKSKKVNMDDLRAKNVITFTDVGECTNCGVYGPYEFIFWSSHTRRVYGFCSLKCFREWLRTTRAIYPKR
jgi:hypothetical protein